MFVSFKYSRVALIGSGALVCMVLSGLYYLQVLRSEAEASYYGLLQKQTAIFAEAQLRKKRLEFIQAHANILDNLQQANPVQLRVSVLLHLEKVVSRHTLLEVAYTFLSIQQHLVINSEVKILHDSLRLRGAALNMPVFNNAISDLGRDGGFFFELGACDISRGTPLDQGLKFDCLLRWYFLE